MLSMVCFILFVDYCYVDLIIDILNIDYWRIEYHELRKVKSKPIQTAIMLSALYS